MVCRQVPPSVQGARSRSLENQLFVNGREGGRAGGGTVMMNGTPGMNASAHSWLLAGGGGWAWARQGRTRPVQPRRLTAPGSRATAEPRRGGTRLALLLPEWPCRAAPRGQLLSRWGCVPISLDSAGRAGAGDPGRFPSSCSTSSGQGNLPDTPSPGEGSQALEPGPRPPPLGAQ